MPAGTLTSWARLAIAWSSFLEQAENRGTWESSSTDASLRAMGPESSQRNRLLSPAFVQRWAGRILNIHPSLLPKYKGLDTHARAIEAGDAIAGASVHLVTEALDDGPVIAQAEVPVEPGDTPDTLAARVLTAEHRLYPQALDRFLSR